LLADALDGNLGAEDEVVFTNHLGTCAACAALFEEAQRGQQWLEYLTVEPEVPEGLLERILSETAPGHRAMPKLAVAGGAGNVVMMPQVWQRPGLMVRLRRFAEPRLMMTAAMAFFSIALTISVSGIKLSSVRMADLRPKAVKSYLEKRIMTASTPVVRYYDHLRFVYEMESRMRELRRNSDEPQPAGSQPDSAKPQGESKSKDGGSEWKQEPKLPPSSPESGKNQPAWKGDLEETRLDAVPHGAVDFMNGASVGSRQDGLALPERGEQCVA
jgi:hypothetical protein